MEATLMSTTIFMISCKTMQFNISKTIGKLIAGAAATICCFSCVEMNYHVGEILLPLNQQFDIFTEEFDIEEMDVCMTDSLSAYSDLRFTIGAVRDDTFGLSTRSTVITLVPINDTLDFGTNPEFKQFHFTAVKDTTSYTDNSQANIIQNINVYELSKPIDKKKDCFAGSKVSHSDKRVTKGRPVYNGKDSLSFDFSEEFGKKYMSILQSDLSGDLDSYLKKFPGIYITTDEPVGNGGRINMFDVELSFNKNYYSLDGNFAELKFKSSYDGERKDTSFVFYFCPSKFEKVDSLLAKEASLNQFAYNVSTYESGNLAGKAGDVMLVEGGSGLKPRVKAEYLYKKLNEVISKHGDPSKATISKATIELPFIFPDNYEDMVKYPSVLSPTVRIVTDTTVTYANLTDFSIKDENQGDINRSTCKYTPDITHHAQEIIGKKSDFNKFSNYDIWFLAMAYEITTTTTEGNSDMSDLYQQLAYNSYYSSMYGGGYGGYGYGGYGGYGYGGYDSYSSYYTYMMMAQYAGQSQSTTSEELELDKDRYYNAKLVGPTSTRADKPKMKITFALPKQ